MSDEKTQDPWRCTSAQGEYYFDHFMKFASKPADVIEGLGVLHNFAKFSLRVRFRVNFPKSP